MRTYPSDIVTRVCAIAVSQVGAGAGEVGLGTRFDEDLGYDSLDRTEFEMLIEEAFDVQVPEEEAAAVQTIEDAVALVERLRARQTESPTPRP